MRATSRRASRARCTRRGSPAFRCAACSRRSKTYSSRACPARQRVPRRRPVPDRRLAAASLIVFCSCAASPVAAQEAPVIRLTVEEAQARGVAASHRLAEARARVAAAKAFVDVRGSADMPSVAAVGGYTRTNHVLEFTVPGPTGPRVLYPDVPNNSHARLDLQWPIYNGGQTGALERAAQADASAAAADVSVAQSDLRLEVGRAFWAVVTAREAVTVLEQGVARSQAH